MTEIRSRRAFLTRAWRDALAAAPQVASSALPGVRPAQAPGGLADPSGTAGRQVVSASPAQDTVTLDELLRMAAEFELAGRQEVVQSLARSTVRLVPGDTQGRSRLDESLVQIDLAELAPLGVRSGLPADGLLQFCCDISEAGERWRGAEDPGVRVVHIPESEVSAPEPDDGAVPLGLSMELSLPRVWSAAVQDIGLDEGEQQAWQELRFWLAGRQGVQLFDQVDGHLVAHRLFGYPDERTGEMPLICELLAAEVELGEHPLVHPMAPELEPLAGRWKLLLQLSAGDGMTWPWTGRYERLYFWIDEHQLEVGDTSAVIAVAQ